MYLLKYNRGDCFSKVIDVSEAQLLQYGTVNDKMNGSIPWKHIIIGVLVCLIMNLLPHFQSS